MLGHVSLNHQEASRRRRMTCKCGSPKSLPGRRLGVTAWDTMASCAEHRLSATRGLMSTPDSDRRSTARLLRAPPGGHLRLLFARRASPTSLKATPLLVIGLRTLWGHQRHIGCYRALVIRWRLCLGTRADDCMQSTRCPEAASGQLGDCPAAQPFHDGRLSPCFYRKRQRQQLAYDNKCR